MSWPLGSGYGERDGNLVVQPPGWTRSGHAVCGDCGLDDEMVSYARLCRWCADLRLLRERTPPPGFRLGR